MNAEKNALITQNDVNTTNFKLNHTLITNRISFDDNAIIAYGIKIDKFDLSGTLIDSATVNNLTSNKGLADYFLKLLKDGFVTPCTLLDIAEDFVP